MRTQVLEKVGYNYVTKKENNITVSMVCITPEIAKYYLSYNTKNRKQSEKSIKFLVEQMEKGLFLENGESIVFDKNMKLTDGQHRLLAIIKSGKSYNIPVVKGVDIKSMATYDTGKNRSSGDVLSLNGYKQSTKLSALIKTIYKYVDKGSKTAITSTTNRTETLTNQQVLEYCNKNYDWLIEMNNNINSIYQKSTLKVLSVTNLSLIAYILGGKKPSKDVYSFIKHLCGVSKKDGTATSYLYNRLHNSKIKKEPLSFYWVLGMSIKSWNYYIDGNPSVRFYKFNIEQNLPKVNVNNN